MHTKMYAHEIYVEHSSKKKDHICVLEVIKMFNNGHRFKPLQYIKITKYYGTIKNAKVALYVIL